MACTALHHDAFLPELEALSESVQDELLAGSKHANMKELRFTADDGVWRAAFAFDPKRRAIVLVAGDKSGVAQKRFYKGLIAKADARFAEHLETLKG